VIQEMTRLEVAIASAEEGQARAENGTWGAMQLCLKKREIVLQ